MAASVTTAWVPLSDTCSGDRWHLCAVANLQVYCLAGCVFGHAECTKLCAVVLHAATGDFSAIASIGQDGKMSQPAAIGRFGLGFNAV